MDDSKRYFIIEQTVPIWFVHATQQEQSVPGQISYWLYGEVAGIAKVTRGTTGFIRELHYALTLNEKETGKISVELKNLFAEPIKNLVAEDAVFQIIVEMTGRRFSTDLIPLEKDLMVLKKEILHDFVWKPPTSSEKAEVKVTITVGARYFDPTFQPENPFQIYKNILQEGIGSNFVIVSSSGTEIKCHKSFLCAHSDVLRAMIEGSLTEAVTNKVEMVDLTDEAAKAFLAFLYYWDITKASKDSAIALELLHAAHKYNVASLETAMRDLFLKKEVSWFTVDGAVKLFAFCRNLDNGQELKMRGVQLLKAYVGSLDKSECFKELFKKDPEAAMDLFKCCVAS